MTIEQSDTLLHRLRTARLRMVNVHAPQAELMNEAADELVRLSAALHSAEHRLAMIAAVTPEDTDVGHYARLHFRG